MNAFRAVTACVLTVVAALVGAKKDLFARGPEYSCKICNDFTVGGITIHNFNPQQVCTIPWARCYDCNSTGGCHLGDFGGTCEDDTYGHPVCGQGGNLATRLDATDGQIEVGQVELLLASAPEAGRLQAGYFLVTDCKGRVVRARQIKPESRGVEGNQAA
jgi:hypothetical protein